MMALRYEDGSELGQRVAHVTGLVNQEVLLRNECLAAANRILRAQLPVGPSVEAELATLAEIGKRVGRKALAQSARVVKLDGSVATAL